GDVTGHGIPACIVGAIANSLFYSYSGVKDLKTIVRDVNVVLKKKMMANMFMTTCLLKWEASRSVLSYVNAGHEPILCYSAKSGQVMEGDKGGLALGMIADLGNVKEVGINMQVGDVVVIYSDGIVEAWKNEKETYGMDRLKKTVLTVSKAKKGTATATEIKDAILADVAKFTAGYKQRDDVTLIVVKRV
ncbi:MAG: PP2C family protein-serine/threonine phosphatase, partial [Candidatus Gracilibacteria bacterium]